RAPRTGLAKQKVDIPVEVVERTIPIPAMQRALKNMLDATPQRTTKFKRIRKAMENLDSKKPIRLTVDELDSLRRSFANMVDDAGVRYDLGDASKALTEVAERQLPEYAEFVKKYAQLQRAAEGFKTGRGVMTEGPNTARVDIAGLDAYGRAGATRGAMTRINEAFTTTPEPVRVAAQISARRDAIIEAMGPQGRQLVEAAETAMNRVQSIADEIAEITEAARNTREGLSDAAKRRVRQLRQAAKKEAEAINSKFVRDRAALRAADEVLSQRSSNFAAATEGADPNLPLGAVARGSVADTARQSPADALRTAERLRDTSTRQRIGAVAGEDTAARLAEVGAGQTRAAANLSRAAVRGPNDMPISEEVSAALEIAATLTGRAGAGFAANAIRRQLIRSNTLSLSENQATALARAVTSNDPAVVSQLIDRLGRTQAQRELIEQALGRIAVSLGAVLPSTRGEGSETDQAIRDLVANGYSRAEAEEIVSYTP
nr:hypothetical protein [Hyphomicrobium sp.]